MDAHPTYGPIRLTCIAMKTSSPIHLRPTVHADLPAMFLFQADEASSYMSAFNSKDHKDQAAYLEKYHRLLADPTIHLQTILLDGTIVGSVSKYVMEGDAEITYGIDRQHWGKGIATEALRQFLALEPTRPIWGRAAFDNIGSQRVMERCGFVRVGKDKGYANSRGAEIVEFIYRLE